MSRNLLSDYLTDFERRERETAFIDRRGDRLERWSYGRTAAAARRFARELEARRIGPGERVLLWGDNCAEWVAAFYGCQLRGAVVVPMDRIAAPDFALRVARQVEARLLVASPEQAAHAAEFPLLPLETLENSIAGHSSEPGAPPSIQPSDPVQIIFTSGTTSDPRGVVLSHRNILANLQPLEREIARYLKYERLVHPLRFLNLLPLSHVFGQFMGMFVPQLLGGVVVFQNSLNPSEILATVRRERVSVLVGVPRLLESLRHFIEQELEEAGEIESFRAAFRAARGEHFLRRWWRFRRIHRRFGWKFWAFVSGGAALDSEAEEFWGRVGFAVIQGYGLTETASLVTVNHPFQLGKGSIGKVLPGRELRLGESGEILVRGENIASGYWQGKELVPVSSQDGWFATGDIGEEDEAGNLYFKGRKKNVLVTAEGMNVHPEDLEEALRRQPAVRDCVVVGLTRNGNTEPCAVLLLQDPGADAAGAVQAANQLLAGYQRMRHWFVWPEEDFPRTATHKPKLGLIELAAQQHLAGRSVQAGADGGLSALIQRITGRAAGKLAPEASLTEDLNLTSMERVELLSALEDRYQVDLNESRFTAATTVGQLEEMLRKPVGARPDYHYPRWTQRRPVVWIRILAYYLLTWPATVLLAFPKVSGRRRLRGIQGPVLVVCNHTTRSDIGFILFALPLRLRHRLAVAMEGERLQSMRRPPESMNTWRRCNQRLQYLLVVALFNVFPLPQTSGFRRSFAFAGETVDRGFSLLVFPEGRLTRDGRIGPFAGGIGLLAESLGIPVIPVRIAGLWEVKQTGRRRARPGKVRVWIGEPVRYPAGSDPEEITADLRARVVALGSQGESD